MSEEHADGAPRDEFGREGFEQEFESWDEFTAFFEQYGTAFIGERIRVGEYVIQSAPHDAGRFQIAHRRYKGNIERDKEIGIHE